MNDGTALKHKVGDKVHQRRDARIYGYVRGFEMHAFHNRMCYRIWWSNSRSEGGGWEDYDLA